MDAGYVTGELLVDAKQDLDVDVCGPVKPDVAWQATQGQGFDLAHFKIDWAAQSVTCPNAQTSTTWTNQTNSAGHPVISVGFAAAVCRACADQAKCTHAALGARHLQLRPEAQHTALQKLRETQVSADFRKAYAKRSGIEGTLSEGVRVCGLRRARYRGRAKTHLQMISSAVAINLNRLFDWWTGVKRSVTRLSPFAQLGREAGHFATSWRL